MHTALLMIELINATRPTIEHAEQLNRFNHLIDYIFDRFSEPVAMAIVKYAIADRKMVIRKLSESSSWSRISKVFKPVMLDDTKDPLERAKFSRFERIYKRLHACKPISDAMLLYVIEHQHDCE
jgi:Na+/serine symporter